MKADLHRGDLVSVDEWAQEQPNPMFAHPGVTAPVLPLELPAEADDCLVAAVVVHGDQRVWFPCRSHKGGVHNFAASWPTCPAPWCRLPYSHYEAGTMHDIPGGKVELRDAIGAVTRG